jgi:hypothetical protein
MEENQLLEFRRIQWTSFANTLSRIKADEQKWLFYAFATFGGFVSLFFSGKAKFDISISTPNVMTIFFWTSVVLEVFLIYWTEQTLTYRQQYYTTMGRLFNTEMNLEQLPPKNWSIPHYKKFEIKSPVSEILFIYFGRYCWIPKDKFVSIKQEFVKTMDENDKSINDALYKEIVAANHWRSNATGPNESKIKEIFMVNVLFYIAILAIAFSLAGEEIINNYELQLFLSFYAILSFFIWPLIFYPIIDKRKLRKVYWDNVKSIQSRYANSTAN